MKLSDFDTDSHFDTGNVAGEFSDSPVDLRLIHESKTGYCAVYSGLYQGRRIALKFLKNQYRASEFHQRLLRKEFEVMSMMNHPNIVAALKMVDLPDYGEAILMEYIEGTTLVDYLGSNPKPTRQELTGIIEQICLAVNYIHSRQTVHCDLKPSNVLITSSGRFVKIVDFGMCRGNGFEPLDLAGGTQGFTAPENFKARAKASVATDIYSIGKIMEFMDRGATMSKVWKKCIAPNPADRPGSALEIIEFMRRSRSKKIQVFAVALLALIAGGLFIIPGLINRPEPAEEASTADNQEDIATIEPKDSLPEKSQASSVKPMPAHEIAAIESAEPADDKPFDKLMDEKFAQVATQRFNDHILLIDTMTTLRSMELQQVGHWRWLAKQDMKKWLTETLGNNYAQIEHEMSRMDQRLNEFMLTADRTWVEWGRRRDAALRNPDLSGCTTKHAYYEGLDMLVVRRLGEDGIWHETRTRVPINRLDPEENLKTKHEYLQKALAD